MYYFENPKRSNGGKVIGIDMKPDLQMCLVTFELPGGMFEYNAALSLSQLNELQSGCLKSLPDRLQGIQKQPVVNHKVK